MSYKLSSIGKVAMAFCVCIGLSGCSQVELASHYTKKIMASSKGTGSKGSYKVGSPYTIGGKRYYPKEDYNLREVGVASWYGPGFHGKKTANGEIYDQYAMTAAHRTLQLPAIAKVTNLRNGRSVILRINDRGPYASGRILDVSKAAAKKLGFLTAGTTKIRLEVLQEESLRVAAAAKRGKPASKYQYTSVQTKQRVAAKPKSRNTRAQGYQVASYKQHPSTQAHQKSAPRPYQRDNNVYLANDATMDYEPMGQVKGKDLPESLHRPVMTTRQVETQSDSYGRNIDAPNWNDDRLPSSYYPTDSKKPAPVVLQNDATVIPTTPPARQARPYTPPVQQQPTHIASPAGSVYVQAGAFKSYDNANRLSQKLQHIANVHISEVDVNNTMFYRVRLGPLADVAQARQVEQDVLSSVNTQTRVIIEK